MNTKFIYCEDDVHWSVADFKTTLNKKNYKIENIWLDYIKKVESIKNKHFEQIDNKGGIVCRKKMFMRRLWINVEI